MINFRIIYKILGSLLFIEVALMLSCLGMALYFEEDDSLAFAISVIITLLGAILLRYAGRNAENRLSRRDSFLVVTLAWVTFSIFGTLPFLIGGYLHSFTDAFFETMSGFTTTGATIIDNVEALPHGILFWRSLTQWIGGLGIVFFTVALLPSLVGGSTRVFAAEATGPVKTKLHPKLSMGARWIWMVYLFITFSCMGSYMFFGMDWFQGINYAMTSSATGGFAIHNDSMQFFNSPAIEYTTTFFCFLSGVNFTLLYFSAAKFKFKELWRDSEFQFYCLVILGFTAFIMAELMLRNHYDIEHAFRSGLFQVVSFITTTGLFNDDAAQWPHVTWVVLSVCMFIG
ncbi:TrkH family potassium uptake protein, partial [Hallella bergensis]|uniref:TrkH family potassium uptake protein n=1 Tax=Hallella bergensis TaxID=242750 RepID=UPI003990A85E